MARALKITNTDSSGQIHDRYTRLTYINGAYIGGTGGNTTQAGRQIQAVAKIGSGGTAANTSIITQKGAHKFRVYNATDKFGTCTLANIGTPTATNTMSIRMDLNEFTGNITAANVAGGATQTYVTYSSATLVGPRALAAGDWILGFASGNISSNYGAKVTSVNAAVGLLANVTVAVSGNIAAQTGQTLTNTRYATRITNDNVYDFNGVRYRYRLAVPDSTFVRVWYT